MPVIHKEIIDKYNGLPPSDEALKSHLLLEKNFKDEAVDDFIKEFTATMAFAKIVDSATFQEKKSESDSDKELEKESMQKRQDPPLSPQFVDESHLQAQMGNRRWVFALTEGDVVITAPDKLSAESVSDLADCIEIFIKKAKRDAALN